MSREIGGRADKDGNEYEKLWVVSLALDVLEGKATSLLWEPLGEAGLGAELLLTKLDGRREAHQCKIENGLSGKWTVADLARAGVLQAARRQLEHGGASRFVFVSQDRSILSDFAERSRRCSNDPRTFLDSVRSSAEHRRELTKLFETWEFDSDETTDASRAVTLLQRLGLEHGFWEPSERDRLARNAAFLAEGEGQEIVESLGAFLTSCLGNEVHADELRCHLKAAGFPTRDLHGVSGPIERLQRLFENALCGFLVGDDLIPRTETQQVLDILLQKEGPRLVFLHGEAGGGKSGVLLELTRKLSDEGVPFLPLRFDVQMPQGSVTSFSRDVLELPTPPIHCLAALAGTRHSVLIIDQLDAVRWTGAHSDAAWSIAREIVETALTRPEMRVVLACRTFDLDDDPRIKSWQERISRKPGVSLASRIEVKPLSEETVRSFILSQEARYEDFSPRQQQLLANPHNLYLWWTLHREQAVPQNFDSKAKLMARFWGTRMRWLQEKRGIQATDIEALLDKIVGYLDAQGRLDAPSILVGSYCQVFDGLRSLNVLHEPKSGSVKFTHQSYLDYLIAERVIREALTGGRKPIDWVRQKDQSLFRRDQLRQMLMRLREERHDLYLSTLQDLLTATDIRFHLQHLTLELLHYASPPSNQELILVQGLLTNPEWRKHAIDEVLSGSAAWFEQLDEVGVLTEWLRSDNEQTTREALLFCRFATESHPKRVESLLAGYWSTGDEAWQRRIESALPFEAQYDTDEMFLWRLSRTRKNSKQTEWYSIESLAATSPHRAILLLEAFFMGALDSFEALGSFSLRDWHPSTTIHIKKACLSYPQETWQALLTTLLRAITIFKVNRQCASNSWSSKRSLRQLTWRARHLLSLAGAELATSEGPQFGCRLQDLSASKSPAIQRLVLSTLLHSSEGMADFAIEWLCRDSRRLQIRARRRDPDYKFAALLIKRFADKCSLGAYRKLEELILSFHPPLEKEGIRWSLANWRGKKGWPLPNDYGFAQGDLLKAMPQERMSKQAKNFASLWWAKFESTERQRYHTYLRSHTSSIPDDKLHLVSDRQWLKLITKEERASLHRQSNNHTGRPQLDHAKFASEMRAAAVREPERFARLALRIPATAPIGYFRSLIEAFSEVKPPDQIRTKYPDWRPATTVDVEMILNHVGDQTGKLFVMSACRLIEKRAEEDWTEGTLARILKRATTHADPDASEIKSGDLANIALDSVRGHGAETLRALIKARPELLTIFLPMVRRLASDPNPAVRVAAQGICPPIYRLDPEVAMQLFTTSCSHADERALRGPYIDQMLRVLWRDHPDRVEPLLERMVFSDDEEVAETGAFWATAGRVGESLYEEVALRCCKGSSAQRRGVASALSAMYSDPKWNSACASALPAFFEDQNEAVRTAASQVFRRASRLDDQVTSDLALKYVRSIGFEKDPLSLVFPLERHKGSLLPLSESIKAIATRISSDMVQAARNLAVTHHFVPVLLRLYEQAEGEQNREIRELCLDAWDDLLRSGVEIGRKQLQQLEH